VRPRISEDVASQIAACGGGCSACRQKGAPDSHPAEQQGGNPLSTSAGAALAQHCQALGSSLQGVWKQAADRQWLWVLI